jgi:hypothetical protein
MPKTKVVPLAWFCFKQASVYKQKNRVVVIDWTTAS